MDQILGGRIMAVLVYFYAQEKCDNGTTKKVYFDASEYIHDIYSFQRAISSLRKGRKLMLPILVITGQEVYQKTGTEEVVIPFVESDDWYAQAFGYSVPDDGRRLWRYLFGCNKIPLNYGDIIKISPESDELYLLADFMILKHRDFYGIGDNALSLLTVKLFPFSEDAVTEADGCIDRLAPTCTQTWKESDWKRYFGKVVKCNSPLLWNFDDMAKALVVGRINYDTMIRLAEMQHAPCVV